MVELAITLGLFSAGIFVVHAVEVCLSRQIESVGRNAAPPSALILPK